MTKAKKSRTQKAVDAILRARAVGKALTLYAAEKKFKVDRAAIHRAIKRLATQKRCPLCGGVVKRRKAK